MLEMLDENAQTRSQIDFNVVNMYPESLERYLSQARSESSLRLTYARKRYPSGKRNSWQLLICEENAAELLSFITSKLEDVRQISRPRDPLDSALPEITRGVIHAWVRLTSFSRVETEHHRDLLDTSVKYREIVGADRKGMHFDPWSRDAPDEQNARQRRARRFAKNLADRIRPDKNAAKKPAKINRTLTPKLEPRPMARLIRSPRDAEIVATDWMIYWGFLDARVTPIGPDEGIDVVSSGAVAQVKAHMVPIGRPELQGLAGVAAIEGKIAIFFALNGFTPQAIEWGNRAKMALFRFDLQGMPEPVNSVARAYIV